jgi:hypothetical protein
MTTGVGAKECPVPRLTLYLRRNSAVGRCSTAPEVREKGMVQGGR